MKKIKKLKSQGASVEWYDETEEGVTIIKIECLKSGDTETVYGDGSPSKRRGLAMLTENCSCGAKWHFITEDTT